jgi:23S rRNA pseudouridine2605 synthase
MARRTRRRPATAPPVGESTEKLQKVLAHRGLGSRREIEGWIQAGRIRINGRSATLGDRVTSDDRIEIDGKALRRPLQLRPRVLLLNKAEGVVCTRRDPEGRPTCFDDVPKLATGRWISVGRLDATTTGLLLVTNDGALAHRLMHPSTGLDREYAVRVDRRIDAATEQVLREGVLLEDGIARFSDIRYYDGTERNHWYHVTLMEGRNREVRRLFESQQIRISRLKRVRYGPVVLPSALRRGRSLELSSDDVRQLYRLLGLPLPAIEPPRRPAQRKAEKKLRSVLIPYPELDRARG